MYSGPRSRPGAAEEGAGLGGAASRGRGRAWRDGGRARKICFPNLLPSLLHTPLRSLLSHSLPRKLLGVNRLFLLLSKMGPASAEARGGRRQGRRGRPGATFSAGWLPPFHGICARERPGSRPGPGQRGPLGLLGLIPGLGRGASPHSVAGGRRGIAGDPRPRAWTSLPSALARPCGAA